MSMQVPASALKVGLLGYGEVGTILGRELREKGVGWVGAWDVLFRDPAEAPAMKRRASEHGVEVCTSLPDLPARAGIVISVVTAAWVAALARSGLFRELGADVSWRDCADKMISSLEKTQSKTRSGTR
jgi:3-hydroxyisobutyrate dehydrogenase-like beta-hydroxyacid dehydrogenase